MGIGCDRQSWLGVAFVPSCVVAAVAIDVFLDWAGVRSLHWREIATALIVYVFSSVLWYRITCRRRAVSLHVVSIAAIHLTAGITGAASYFLLHAILDGEERVQVSTIMSLVIVVCGTTIVADRNRVKRDVDQRIYCPSCGYDMSDSQSTSCCECGLKMTLGNWAAHGGVAREAVDSSRGSRGSVARR